jgi:nitrogen fixation protein NifQ
MDTTCLDEEIADLAALLQEFASEQAPPPAELIKNMAQAAMQPNHLWEDLGLASRDELQALMQRHFPRLKALNHANMRWKKFFYRLLCEREQVLICKSPHCETCEDQALCFGPE